MLNGVGVVAATKRKIKPGKEFDGYFPAPGYADPILTPDGNNEMTIDRFIPQIVRMYQSDTGKIAVVLKQGTLESTLKSIFDFIYGHIQYKQDSPYEEQIRRPARSWADRQSGVDCDCYTVFISSILTNLKIPHYLRMTAYSKVRGYQHIYVVVPKKGNSNMSDKTQYWTVDPVLDGFNVEKPYLRKRDRLISVSPVGVGLNGFPIRMLNGNNEPVFASRTDLVEQDVYYSPILDTWALKGLDGGFYIEGDSKRRYVAPLNGDDYVFINTGVGVDGLFKKIGKVAKKVGKAAVKVATKVALPMAASIIPGGSAILKAGESIVGAVKNSGVAKAVSSVVSAVKPAVNSAASQVQTQVNNLVSEAGQPFSAAVNTVSQAAGIDTEKLVSQVAKAAGVDVSAIKGNIAAANKAMVTSIASVDKKLNDGLIASNKATIMSLATMDKSVKDKISEFGNNFGSELKKMLEADATISEIVKNVDKISLEALKSTANIQKQQTAIEAQTSELIESGKAETIKDEQFRTEQRNTNRIIIIVLVAIAVLLLYVTIKQSKS